MVPDDSTLREVVTVGCNLFCSFLIWIASIAMGVVYGIFYFEDHRQSAWNFFLGSVIGFGVSTLVILGNIGYVVYRNRQMRYQEL